MYPCWASFSDCSLTQLFNPHHSWTTTSPGYTPGLSGTARNPLAVSLPLGNSTVCVFGACARTSDGAEINPKTSIAETNLRKRFMLRCLPYEQTVHCKPVRASAPSAIERTAISRCVQRSRRTPGAFPQSGTGLGRYAFYLNGRAVGKYFGDALHHLGGVVAHADHGVRTVLAGMLHHQFEGFFAGFFAHFFEQRDVAAHQ